jgi:hypothetical protein
MIRSWLRSPRFALVALACLAACAKPAGPPPRNAREAAAVDTLTGLLRQSVGYGDPVPAYRKVVCEIGTIYDEFGEIRGDELIGIAKTRAHTGEDRGAQRRLDSALAGHVFYSTCPGRPRDPAKGARADSAYVAAHRLEGNR